MFDWTVMLQDRRSQTASVHYNTRAECERIALAARGLEAMVIDGPRPLRGDELKAGEARPLFEAQAEREVA